MPVKSIEQERRELESAIEHLKGKKIKTPVLRMLEKQLQQLENKELEKTPVRNAKQVNLEFVYKNKSGEPLYGVSVRRGKRTLGHYHGDSAIGGLNGVAKVPYRLPEILKTDRVFVCESEQIADRIHAAALVGTSSIDGFSGFDSLHAQWLKGKKIYLIHAEGRSSDEIKNLRMILFPLAHTLNVCPLSPDLYSRLENGELNQDQILQHTKGSGDYWESRKALNMSRSDAGNATRFLDLFENDVRFVKKQDDWLLWNGSRWVYDRSGDIIQMAKKVPDVIWDELTQTPPGKLQNSLERWHIKSTTTYRLEAMLKQVSNHSGVRVASDELDRDPLMIGLKNGVYDIRTGAFREGERSDLITRSGGIAYNPKLTCSSWNKYLEKIKFQAGKYSVKEQDEFIDYLKALAVYVMTADIRIEKFFYLYGPGGSGKTTFTETLSQILGEYRELMPEGSMIERPTHPTDLADLVGKRMYLIPEAPNDEYLNEYKFKVLTGEASIKARKMAENFFEFPRMGKLLGQGNHQWKLRHTSNDMKRRFHVIPFSLVVKRPDPSIKAAITKNPAGVFNEIVKDFKFDQMIARLHHPPRVVIDATNRYFHIQDSMGDFISEYCIIQDKFSVGKTELYHAYYHFMRINGYNPMGMSWFRESLQRRSDERNLNLSEYRATGAGGRRWRGIALKSHIQRKSAKGELAEFFISSSK